VRTAQRSVRPAARALSETYPLRRGRAQVRNALAAVKDRISQLAQRAPRGPQREASDGAASVDLDAAGEDWKRAFMEGWNKARARPPAHPSTHPPARFQLQSHHRRTAKWAALAHGARAARGAGRGCLKGPGSPEGARSAPPSRLLAELRLWRVTVARVGETKPRPAGGPV
jgi:hypothetical protein